MVIKTIKVEVPKGCTTKYDAATQTIKFIPEDYTVIKDFKTACRILEISSAIPAEIQANKQLAKHVSKYFAPLVFDCCFARELGFSLSNGEMVTKNYSIND